MLIFIIIDYISIENFAELQFRIIYLK